MQLRPARPILLFFLALAACGSEFPAIEADLVARAAGLPVPGLLPVDAFAAPDALETEAMGDDLAARAAALKARARAL